MHKAIVAGPLVAGALLVLGTALVHPRVDLPHRSTAAPVPSPTVTLPVPTAAPCAIGDGGGPGPAAFATPSAYATYQAGQQAAYATAVAACAHATPVVHTIVLMVPTASPPAQAPNSALVLQEQAEVRGYASAVSAVVQALSYLRTMPDYPRASAVATARTDSQGFAMASLYSLRAGGATADIAAARELLRHGITALRGYLDAIVARGGELPPDDSPLAVALADANAASALVP